MSADPPTPEPHADYSHTRDPQAQRTRAELWVIIAVVAVVVAGAILWRAVTGKGAAPQAGWNRNDPSAAPAGAGTTAAAGAGIPPHGVGTSPTPRPIAP